MPVCFTAPYNLRVPLKPNQRLGPYEIVEPLGAGGMGEVYRARDTRLDREVAVKVLPAALSESERVRARFEREAKTISQLNHANICTLHDVGNEDGVEFLVMEFIEGETLEQLLEGGALSLDQALRYGIQIMNALDAAHRQRVVHRDLKPANVMITAQGAKLLDFGLAKIAQEATRSLQSVTEAPTQARDLTEEGTILGTVQYMAPEQLDGAEADARTDIFAFGMLLFEMISGRKTFQGKTRVSLMAAILEQPAPSLSQLQPLSPPALERLIRTCLEKNADDRWQTAHDVELQLRWIEEGGSDVGLPAPVAARRKGRQKASWIVAAAGAIAAAVFAVLWLTEGPTPERLARFSIVPKEGTRFNTSEGLAVSPDGSRIAFSAIDETGGKRVYVRDIGDVEPRTVEGTEGGSQPFWSPDGANIALFIDGKIKRVSATGGAPQTICDAPGFRGGTWNRDGVIVFSRGGEGGKGALHRVPAGGGEPARLTELSDGEFSHRWPWFLPDGNHVLFARQTGEGGVEGDTSTIDVLALDSGETKTVVRANSSVQYVRSGHLLYWREGSIIAHEFDPGRLEVTADPLTLVDRVGYSNTEFASFAASQEGTLVYSTGNAQKTRLAWWDRDGEMIEAFGEGSSGLVSVRLSNDGSRVAYELGLLGRDIWVLDFERGTETRLTSAGGNTNPVWSLDDEWIAFYSTREPSGIYRKRASGIGDAELLYADENLELTYPHRWSADGRTLICSVGRGDTSFDIARLDLDSGELENLVRTPFLEVNPDLSPDGEWLAVASDETGRLEIYVYQLSGRGGRWQVSTDGGNIPSWSRDGKTLYYLASSRGTRMGFASALSTLMSVPIETGATVRVGAPVEVMQVSAFQVETRKYDVSADGSKVLWNTMVGGTSQGAPLSVVRNWPALLDR
jgi:serine/threonine protein kinase